MRLKKLNHNFEKYKDYENEQKMVLGSIVSRLNRIGDFFDVIVKLEKFVIEEVREEYSKLVEVRMNKAKIEVDEGNEAYIKNHFLPAVDALNKKMENSVQNWNYVEREFTTGKIYGFISATKNFYKELDKLNGDDEDEDLHGSSISTLIKDILDNFGRFKMYKAIISKDIVIRLEILLSMQKDIASYKKGDKPKKLTLDDL